MPDSSPRVGIVVRTKNRPWFLRRALADLGAQEYRAWRACVVNDGGDAAVVDEIIAELPPQDRARIEVIHNVVATGRSAAANRGVRVVDTEFVVLHDDDDLWHPAFLARTVDYLDAHPDEIGVVARTEIVYELPTPDGGFAEAGRGPFWADLHEITYLDLLEVNRWVPIGYLYRSVLHDRVGLYDESIHAAEDWDLGLRTLVRHRIGFIDGEPLAFWMQREGVQGELGNSMFALEEEHARYDAMIRDAALREYTATHGAGLALYLTRFIPDVTRRIVREEIVRELDARPSDLQRLRRRFGRRRERD